MIIQFLALPNATVYGGIGFLTAKSKDSNSFTSAKQTHLHRYLSVLKFLPCCVCIPQYQA